ncbi:dihydrolipoyl dehydrogenase [Tenacibaculum finnmarkense genomovar finnmarkense]|uniref:dihydrolipoyl dehydrogenase n=1 Tax=Tenacibaculum finnmarkense TaxID=2781243 RepID=UPI001E56007C|nr:dihydrolipoyl dehydrogenase [Tenacibaculum finnmarkense]MCD8416360.1 dihydrolipoyl dehydrogenase [Tenacibaculum finnmarkense genomovar finnmarkense]MCG8185020.1 dihydrolipoyl dehydrogenase [Tenacibaculum finnmarkense genomovar finnmarkense]MCG8201146.1 dihydrolipoyl dehydrogenase [Tenacibaculum finnmarkense genomovar finnmarkense]MCG8208979.1 dihydrolipoyl dehydrogenase [Tenacibaculum finnmarkense genomovar finnmarkense]MCG8211706.1 dihydrolipoyl dehydrogenase [Tenacibaculum finnmarkense ge
MKYDLIVIGSGPGGYISAIRAAQLGSKVAIIEKYSTLGGTCLNVGCIPSKALLDSSHHYYDAVHHFDAHGITVEKPSFDFGKMVERKANIVETTTGGIKYLMDKNQITVHEGLGSFEDATHVKVTKNDGTSEVIEGTNIIIATGSKPSTLPFIKLDKERVITSTEALKLKEVPKHLLVIGGGVIGLELGSVYKRLGADVTVIEYAPKITPTMDADVSKELTKVLKKQGMKINANHGVTSVERNGDEVIVKATNKKGEEVTFTGDYCLVAVGRKAFTQGLNLEKAGVKLTDRGMIDVNDHLQTSASNIYAIGDVVRGAMLAHKAEEEGVVVAEFLAGQKPHIDYNLIPGIVYTWPEVAAVGKTEQELKDADVAYKVGKFSMRALGRSRASGDLDGFVKVLADKNTDEILGVHMVGARVADLIMEAAVAMEFRASAEDLARICHGHPTYSEAVKEAAKGAWDGKPLNA